MDSYSLIVVADETEPVRRFEIPKRKVRRLVKLCIAVAAALLLAGVDYVRVRIDQVELDSLRDETAHQRDRISAFESTLGDVQSRLDQLREFERKVRIIANLPGSSATGGTEVTEVDDEATGDLGAAQGGAGDLNDPLYESGMRETEAAAGRRAGARTTNPVTARVSGLRQDAERLGLIADAREVSLIELIESLEQKRHRLASTPSTWPAKGWLTSRFGPRISPFTGGKQFHAGIDIAGKTGTPVTAPARGRVVFSGSRGPLGNSLIIDHGFGVRTLYGHNSELFVKRGEQVERGQKIGSLGSTGRSTGPHLHYVVEVSGKARNPLDYIFD